MLMASELECSVNFYQTPSEIILVPTCDGAIEMPSTSLHQVVEQLCELVAMAWYDAWRATHTLTPTLPFQHI